MRQATFSNAAFAGMARRRSSADLRNRLLLDMASRRRGAGRLSAGFTLIELMIVIVIVGILSALAIPNLLKQTEKAKATEAKTAISAILKQAHAQYIEDAIPPREVIADMVSTYGAPENGVQKFNYAGKWSLPIYSVTAKGNALGGADIDGKFITGCVNITTGQVSMQSQLSITAAAGLPTAPVACSAGAPL